MNIPEEIEKFAEKQDKPVLRWLFAHYHMDWQWRFVAACTHERYGVAVYQTNRVWRPTREGRVLYGNLGLEISEKGDLYANQ